LLFRPSILTSYLCEWVPVKSDSLDYLEKSLPGCCHMSIENKSISIKWFPAGNN
jgi:hypothetical protein